MTQRVLLKQMGFLPTRKTKGSDEDDADVDPTTGVITTPVAVTPRARHARTHTADASMTDRSPTAYAYRDWSDVERVAREHFHVLTLRPGQRKLIEAVLSGRDAFGILPTGGGKSLAFQLPSLFLDRAVVVVSPLLALIRDQSDKPRG